MRIGITMRSGDAQNYAEKRDALSRDWPRYLRHLFPAALIIPIVSRPELVTLTMKKLGINRMILSNGGDWGEDRARDETEKKLLAYCIAHRIPTLGVCRGMQVLNVLFGGRLKKDVKGHSRTIHNIEIVAATPFSKFTKQKIIRVNSYHNHGVPAGGVALGLRVFAKSIDGLIEGLYHPTKPIAGIEWHPERKNPSAAFDKKIITNLFKK